MSNKKPKGKRARTRSVFSKKARQKTTINEIIKKVEINDVVQVNTKPEMHSGFPTRRMQGKTGKIISFQGKTPVVEIKDGNMKKKVMVHRVHLKKLKQIPKGEKNE